MTGAAYVELRIQELAIHDWDIRSATETIPSLYPDSVPILLDMTPRWLGMCFRSSAKLPKAVVYGFNVDSQNYRLTVTGDGFDMISGEVSAVHLRKADRRRWNPPRQVEHQRRRCSPGPI